MENAITTLLASQQLAATQQERLAGLQLHEQVRCYSPRLLALAAALLLSPIEEPIAAMRLRLPVRRLPPRRCRSSRPARCTRARRLPLSWSSHTSRPSCKCWATHCCSIW